MRVIVGILLVLLLVLQYKAWLGDAGCREAVALREQVARQNARAEMLAERNRLLTAEVLALKQGYAAVEARARSDLGMIGPGETFYLVPDSE